MKNIATNDGKKTPTIAQETAIDANITNTGETKTPEREKTPNQYDDIGIATHEAPIETHNPPTKNLKSIL